MIRVLLVDDHPLVRDGIRLRLENLSYADGLQVVGEAANGTQAIEMARVSNPDVILMDISMPLMDGVTATKKILEAVPTAKVIIFSLVEEPRTIQEAMAAGAWGFVNKSVSSVELVEALKTVHQGGRYFCSVTSQVLARALVHQDMTGQDAVGKDLSVREAEVLKFIVSGMRNKEIAAKLAVSVRTVETHRFKIMKKIGVQTAAGLTRYAISKGMVKSMDLQ